MSAPQFGRIIDFESDEQTSSPKNKSFGRVIEDSDEVEIQPNIPEHLQFEEKNSEELQNMSVWDKLAYGQEVARQREYLLGKGQGKGALKGATLGATEYVPGLKPEEGELGGKSGEILGMLFPYGVASKLIGYIPLATKNLPKAIQIGEKLVRSAALGGGVKATEEALGGEIPGKESVKAAGEFAGFHALLLALGKSGQILSNIVKKLPSQQAKQIEKVLLSGEEIPRSIFETQEAALKELSGLEAEELKNIEKQTAEAGKGIQEKLPFGGEAPYQKRPPIQKKVTPKFDELGLKPPSGKPPTNLKEEVGQIFADQPFYNTTEAGKSLKNEVIKLDQKAYRNINKAYEKSKALNEGINEIHPALAHNLEEKLAELEKIPSPSGPQKDLKNSIKKIFKALVETEKGEGGEEIFIGYKPVENQTLLEQAKSLRQKIDYDFAHGNAKNIFKPTISSLEEAASNAAKESGNEEAYNSIKEAKALYKDWAQTFDSDYIRPFRDATNKDFSKLFKGSLDLDEANVLKDILGKSPDGQKLVQASKRELVEKNLSNFFEKPQSYSNDDFKKSLRELEAVISPEEKQSLLEKFKAAQPDPIKFRAKKSPKAVTKAEKQTAKYLDKTPEDIGKMLNTRSGIKKLKQDLSKTPKGKQLFEMNVKQKARSIMKEGDIHKKSTAKEYYEVLNKEKNREIMAEILGEEEVNKVLDELAKKENQGKSLTSIKNLSKKYAMLKFVKYLWPLI